MIVRSEEHDPETAGPANRLLADLLRASTSSSDPAEVVHAAARLLQRFLDPGLVGIWILQQDPGAGGDTLTLTALALPGDAGVGVEERIWSRYRSVPADDPLPGPIALRERRVVHVPQDQLQMGAAEDAALLDADSLTAIPLLGRESPLGVIVLAMPERGQLPASRLEVLEQVVRHLALLLESHRLGGLVHRGREDLRILSEAVENMSLVVGIFTPQGLIRRFNPAVEMALGYPPAELEGRHVLELIHPMDSGAANPRIYRDDFTGRILARHRDGHEVPFEITTVTVGGSNGAPLARVGIGRDLTADLRRERQVKETYRLAAVGELAAGVAHEVNNPLGAIATLSELLLGGELPPDIREDVQAILVEARRAGTLVHNLLSFAGHRATEIQAVDLGSVIRKALVLKRRQLELVDIQVRMEIEEGVPPVMADPNQIQQVVNNLLSNARHAIQHTWEEGEIRLAVRRRGADRVELVVEDTGSGLSDEIARRMFQPFYTTKGVGEGTGLGLPITQEIVTRSGGEVTAENWGRPSVRGGAAGEGGARFTVRLPLASEAALGRVAPVEAPGPEPLRRNRRILLVEDEPVLGRAVARYLRRLSADVVVEHRGRAALERLDSERDFDVVLTDLKMPGMTGQEFYRALEVRYPEMARRVIFTSGDVATAETHRFLESTGRPVLSKPFELAALARLVDEVAAPRAQDGGEGAAASS